MSSAWVLAPAKTNLHLEILGRREDGFHELRTWMVALDLFDRLRARPGQAGERGGRLEVSGPTASADIPTDERNLALRAALAAWERAGQVGIERPQGFVLDLVKEIPSEAGLGGASADAAAAIVAVEGLLDCDLGREFRLELLAELGSDCAFFEAARESGFGLCTGRGEVVQSLSPIAGDWRFLVLTPQLRCPTGAVYAHWQPTSLRGEVAQAIEGLQAGRFRGSSARALGNDLGPAARRAVPELAAWFEELGAALAQVAHPEVFQLSGSGSSVFFLFGDETEARLVLQTVANLTTPLRGSWILKPAGAGLVRIPG